MCANCLFYYEKQHIDWPGSSFATVIPSTSPPVEHRELWSLALPCRVEVGEMGDRILFPAHRHGLHHLLLVAGRRGQSMATDLLRTHPFTIKKKKHHKKLAVTYVSKNSRTRLRLTLVETLRKFSR
jgi:hypothetical protein